jgi:ribonuclease BN (tRNA processing enzyme)
MQITILGSGTAVPSFERFPAGFLVRSESASVLVDLGPGTLRRAAQAGCDPRDIDAVWLTHYHTDHCADLAALLFALRNPRYAGRAPLRVFGAPGLHALVAHLTAAWPWLAPRDYVLDLREIAPGTHELEDLQIVAVPIAHTAASLAYRFTGADGGVCAFSGDADVCEGLVETARDADLFVCEAAFPDAHRQPGHLTPSLAGAHAERAGAKRLCLTHFYPECDGHDLLGQARAAYRGEVVLGKDLMTFTV